VFEIRDGLIRRCFIYLDPDYAGNAVDPVDFWRFGTLASGVVDLRFMALWRRLPNTEMVYRFGSDLHARLKKAAIERLQ